MSENQTSERHDKGNEDIAPVIAAAFLIASACAPAGAQVIIEMSVLKCKDYMEAPPDRQELIAA
jgi:hypothetical protein